MQWHLKSKHPESTSFRRKTLICAGIGGFNYGKCLDDINYSSFSLFILLFGMEIGFNLNSWFPNVEWIRWDNNTLKGRVSEYYGNYLISQAAVTQVIPVFANFTIRMIVGLRFDVQRKGRVEVPVAFDEPRAGRRDFREVRNLGVLPTNVILYHPAFDQERHSWELTGYPAIGQNVRGRKHYVDYLNRAITSE